MKYFIVSILTIAAVCAVFFVRRASPTAVAQEPRRWQSGDTLWYEIDSLPGMPSQRDMILDSLLRRWPMTHLTDDWRDSFPQHRPHYAPIRFDYKIPLWDVYRRSITVWGITFSTGQASPFSPYVYPAEDYPDAEVLSFPLNRPK